MVVPVVVRPCDPEGLLGPLVRINLVGLEQDVARAALLEGVRARTGTRPTIAPAFPGKATAAGGGLLPTSVKTAPSFPGATAAAARPRETHTVGDNKRGRQDRQYDWPYIEGEPPVVRRVSELFSAAAPLRGAPSIELHMVPEQAPPLADSLFAELGYKLVGSGRRHALFETTDAVDLHKDAHCVAAAVSAPARGFSNGLAATRSGQRSAWRSTPTFSRSELMAADEPVHRLIAGLLAVLVSLRSPAPDRVAFALGAGAETIAGLKSDTWIDPRHWVEYEELAADHVGVAHWLTKRLIANI